MTDLLPLTFGAGPGQGLRKITCSLAKMASLYRFSGKLGTKPANTRDPELLFHDLRRTGARNLRRAGVAEGVIMKIGGWRTRSVFERYAIVSRTDMEDAILKLQESERRAEQEQQEKHAAEAQRSTQSGHNDSIFRSAHRIPCG